MTSDVEQSPNPKLETPPKPDLIKSGLIAWAAGRIEKWLGRPNRDQTHRELKLRLDERRRERARIARELHDTLFQGFLGASMNLHEAVDQMHADCPSKPALNRSLLLMRRVIDEGRDALQGLRSNEIISMPLEQALSRLRDDYNPPSGVRLRIFVNGQSRALNPEVQEEMYLIGREAVVNALRHSAATTIEAEVEYSPRSVRVVVRDNGCGIDPKQVGPESNGHWGLLGMRERAGNIGAQLRIWSRPGAGTEVEISVPVHLVAKACA